MTNNLNEKDVIVGGANEVTQVSRQIKKAKS